MTSIFAEERAKRFESYREQKIQQINSESRAALQTLTINGIELQTDDRSVMRIMTAVNRAKEDATFTKTWITKDNTEVPLSNADLVALGDALAQHEEDVVFAARQAKDAVLAATDKSSVDAVDWRDYL